MMWLMYWNRAKLEARRPSGSYGKSPGVTHGWLSGGSRSGVVRSGGVSAPDLVLRCSALPAHHGKHLYSSCWEGLTASSQLLTIFGNGIF